MGESANVVWVSAVAQKRVVSPIARCKVLPGKAGSRPLLE
jgi:hypothetical protein